MLNIFLKACSTQANSTHFSYYSSVSHVISSFRVKQVCKTVHGSYIFLKEFILNLFLHNNQDNIYFSEPEDYWGGWSDNEGSTFYSDSASSSATRGNNHSMSPDPFDTSRIYHNHVGILGPSPPPQMAPPPPPLLDPNFIAELDKRLGQAEARVNSSPGSPQKANFLQDWPERVCNKWEQKTVNMER